MENQDESINLEPYLSKPDKKVTNTTTPPRSSVSDWSDINTDEEVDITDDEDAVDRLRIVLGRNRNSQRKKGDSNVIDTRSELHLASKLHIEEQLQATLKKESPGSISLSSIKL